jgi:hypothetical protein
MEQSYASEASIAEALTAAGHGLSRWNRRYVGRILASPPLIIGKLTMRFVIVEISDARNGQRSGGSRER